LEIIDYEKYWQIELRQKHKSLRSVELRQIDITPHLRQEDQFRAHAKNFPTYVTRGAAKIIQACIICGVGNGPMSIFDLQLALNARRSSRHGY
jgi:hypothetical protein